MSHKTSNKSSQSRKPQQSSEMDAGWTTKKTRQQKKNLKKPKQSKTSINKRKNKRRKSNRNKLLSPTNGYKNSIESPVINDIIQCWPRFKSDISILQTVVNEMNLKSFDPNNDKLKATVLDSITKIKIEKLDQNIDNIVENNQENDIQSTNIQPIKLQNDNENDDIQSIEQKDSSESAPIEQKLDVMIDSDKKSELSEPRDEPQRKKKKRKRKRKRTPIESKEEIKEEIIVSQQSSGSELLCKLNALNLSNIQSTIQQLNEWIHLLRDGCILEEFISIGGIEIIISKIIMSNVSESNRLLSSNIIAIFDILLCGSHEYHEWFYMKLLSLSNNLKDFKVEDDIISVILCEARNLISAQYKRSNNNSECPVSTTRRDEFERPSSLLDSGHAVTDPIVPIFNKLDVEIGHICDLYNDLLSHDIGNRTRRLEMNPFNLIKNNLSENISLISHSNHTLENELFSMKTRQEKLNEEQENKIHIISNTLENQTSEKYRLLSEKKRIENELYKINELLDATEMLIEQSNIRLKEITELFKPKMNKLFQNMSDRQFEIAKLSQKSNIYQLLLSITSESYNSLISFEASTQSHNNSKRNELENSYVNKLYQYLDKLCDAKLMVCNRQNQLEKHIESFKRTNETTNKYYAQNFDINPQIKQYKHIIKIDKETNRNISKHIYENINKAQMKISKELFRKFIQHLQIINQKYSKYGTAIDLTKYTQQQQQQEQPQQQEQHTNQQQQQQQQTNNNNEKETGRSKPPLAKNKPIQSHTNNNQNQNRRGPLPHNYSQTQQQQQQPKRKPPAKNISNQSYY